MESSWESLYREIANFIDGSPAGFLQVLVAAARRSTFERIIGCPTYPVPARSSGLALASKQFREATERNDIHLPTFLARLYASVRTLEHRKYAGQFFTASSVAEWALSRIKPMPTDDICDAGAGSAAFAYAILRSGSPVKSYVGVENEPILTLCGAHVLESMNAPNSFRLWYANFLLLSHSDYQSRHLPLPTFIIANPPFVRFHNLKGRGRIRKQLKSTLGLTLSSLSGSANYFLSRAADLAGSRSNASTPRGRILFFLPKEAEGAVHTRRLWDDLEKLHGWTQKHFDLPQAQTGIDRHPSNALALLCVFEKKDNPIRTPPRRFRSRACVHDVLHVKRGISTGCNEFFVLTDEEARERKLPRPYLRGILPTRIPVPDVHFTKDDWNALRAAGRRCWLLALPKADIEDFEPSVQDYLKEGLRRGVHTTPTAKSLRTWFSIPIPPNSPDVFVTYLFRGAPRFIINQAQVFNLTNILGARFISPVMNIEHQELIVGSLNEIASTWMKKKMAGREYKGGLMKIEPRELSKLPVDPKLLRFVTSHVTASETFSQSLFD